MTDTIERRRSEAPKRRRPRLAPVMAVLLLAALAFTVTGVFPFRQLFQQRQQVERAAEQLELLEAENQTLEDEIAALSTDEEVERLAREQFGLVRPGETAYTLIVPGDAAEEPVDEQPQVDDRSWWEKIWSFVTGSDVGSDG